MLKWVDSKSGMLVQNVERALGIDWPGSYLLIGNMKTWNHQKTSGSFYPLREYRKRPVA